MYVHDPDNPEATNEAMARGEAVAFVPSDTDAIVDAYEPADWAGWTDCGYIDEGEVM